MRKFEDTWWGYSWERPSPLLQKPCLCLVGIYLFSSHLEESFPRHETAFCASLDEKKLVSRSPWGHRTDEEWPFINVHGLIFIDMWYISWYVYEFINDCKCVDMKWHYLVMSKVWMWVGYMFRLILKYGLMSPLYPLINHYFLLNAI